MTSKLTLALENIAYTLKAAELQFESYAKHHYDKGVLDKAETNSKYAAICKESLHKLQMALEETA